MVDEVRELHNNFSDSWVTLSNQVLNAAGDRDRTFPFYVEIVEGRTVENALVTGMAAKRTKGGIALHRVQTPIANLQLFPDWSTGILNYGDFCTIKVSRLPVRQWKRGIRVDTIRCRYPEINELLRSYQVDVEEYLPNDLNFRRDGFHLLLCEMLSPAYLPWRQAVDLVAEGRALGRAVNRYVSLACMTGFRVPVVLYNGEAIGYVDRYTPVLNPAAMQWNERVQETSGMAPRLMEKKQA